MGHSTPTAAVCLSVPRAGGSVWGRGLSWRPVELAEAGVHQEIHAPAAGEGVSGVLGARTRWGLTRAIPYPPPPGPCP